MLIHSISMITITDYIKDMGKSLIADTYLYLTQRCSPTVARQSDVYLSINYPALYLTYNLRSDNSQMKGRCRLLTQEWLGEVHEQA